MNTIEKNKKNAERFFKEVMTEGKLDVIDELVADDFVDHEEFAGLPQNKEGVRQYVKLFREAFPDLKVRLEEILAENDKVVVLSTLSGTHKGDFLGHKGTGRKFELPYADVVKMKNGKAIEHWGYADTARMFEQLQLELTPANN